MHVTAGVTVWAEPADYAAWLDSDATCTEAELRSASLLVSEAIGGAAYAVDTLGVPSSEKVLSALAGATCAVVAFRQETGDTTGNGSTGGGLKSAKIMDAEYTYADSGAGAVDTKGLPGDAVRILWAAGLLARSVYVYG